MALLPQTVEARTYLSTRCAFELRASRSFLMYLVQGVLRCKKAVLVKASTVICELPGALLRCRSFLQTNIITDGFRSLAEGEPVEFTIENGDDGRTKAINVSGPGGAAPQVRTSLCCTRVSTVHCQRPPQSWISRSC